MESSQISLLAKPLVRFSQSNSMLCLNSSAFHNNYKLLLEELLFAALSFTFGIARFSLRRVVFFLLWVNATFSTFSTMRLIQEIFHCAVSLLELFQRKLTALTVLGNFSEVPLKHGLQILFPMVYITNVSFWLVINFFTVLPSLKLFCL